MMSQIEITYQQGHKLAELLHELRSDWDIKGCINFIREARTARPGTCNFDLVVAAVRAAQNPEARTPAVIPLEGPHWHNAVPERPGAAAAVKRTGRMDDAAMCDRCGVVHTSASPCSPPDQRSNGRGAAAAKAALQAALHNHPEPEQETT